MPQPYVWASHSEAISLNETSTERCPSPEPSHAILQDCREGRLDASYRQRDTSLNSSDISQIMKILAVRPPSPVWSIEFIILITTAPETMPSSRSITFDVKSKSRRILNKFFYRRPDTVGLNKQSMLHPSIINLLRTQPAFVRCHY